MDEINLEIISPSKTVFQGAVKSITVPGTKGSFQILKNHAPLVSTLETGVIKFFCGDTIEYFSVSGGTVEVINNKVLILADSIENANEIDYQRALKSKERAMNRLSKREIDIDLARAQASLSRALNRIKTKELYSKKNK